LHEHYTRHQKRCYAKTIEPRMTLILLRSDLESHDLSQSAPHRFNSRIWLKLDGPVSERFYCDHSTPRALIPGRRPNRLDCSSALNGDFRRVMLTDAKVVH
jgi:hypothetical protein